MPTLLITGANRGIGLELCKQYLEADWKVHATCRDPNNATRLSVLDDKYPDALTVHTLDISNASQIEDLKNKLGIKPIDILFNNAGIYGNESSEFGKTDKEDWLNTFNVNVISPMKMIEAFAENVAIGDKKIIASMSSKMASIVDNGSGGSYSYRSSKIALNMVMSNVAIELKPKGITALILHPGWVRTDMGGPNGEMSVTESATSLRNTLEKATLADTGKFYDIDGSIIPW